MIFSLAVYGNPYTTQSAHSAYQFAQTAISQGHTIKCVFFYFEGVHIISQCHPNKDKSRIRKKWVMLGEKNLIDLVICTAATQRRHLVALEEMQNQDDNQNTYVPFVFSGLGQLIDASINSDRFITFGQ